METRRRAVGTGCRTSGVDVSNANAVASQRTIEPASYVLLLTRVQLIVTVVLVAVLSDLVMSGAMREAFRFSILDAPRQYPATIVGLQFPAIIVALVLACAAIRFTAEATIELVSPDLIDWPGGVGLFARLLPRILSAAVGIAAGIPLLWLGRDSNVMGTTGNQNLALTMGLLFVGIGVGVGAVLRGPRAQSGAATRPTFILRGANALVPLALAILFCGTVLGAWGDGIANGIVERYRGAGMLRIAAEAVAVFASCVSARLALAICLDLIAPSLAESGGAVRFLPRLAALAVGLYLAYEIYDRYLGTANAALAPGNLQWVYVLIGAASAIGLAAGFAGGWASRSGDAVRVAPRLGVRWNMAAQRLATLPKGWQRFFAAMLLLAIVVCVLFAAVLQVEALQAIGPVAIILLWGFAATMLLFPIAYLSHITHMPLLLIFLVAGVAFAGFNLNDNHQLRLAAADAAKTSPADPANSYYREELKLASWLSDRQDLYQYDHYPIFLIGTEGGGIRAAYFTANVLAALQERCPAFAQHTLAISGVSGGSVGAAVFAALAADHARNLPEAPCALEGRPAGRLVNLARDALSRDLLSPLLGATLFPDALQRILPAAIDRFDRARAIEYAVEDSWRRATEGCKDCDPDRMSEDVADLYVRTTPRMPVPHLFLNTTEVGTGRMVPFGTMHVATLATPYLSQAEIDPSPTGVQLRVLQDLMDDDHVPLSAAALLSARFPYLTPAGRVGSAGHYVDGGYFENSGTWLLSGVVQNLIGQQLNYINPSDPALEKAVKNAVFVTVVIKSEPCTQRIVHHNYNIRCGDRLQTLDTDETWNEVMSPPRALLNSRDERAETAISELSGLTALVEQLSPQGGGAATDNGAGCDRTLCAVTLRFYSAPKVEVPLSWLLSARARNAMDDAVASMETADARTPVPTGPDLLLAVEGKNTIQGSYRRIICLLNGRHGQAGCAQPGQP